MPSPPFATKTFETKNGKQVVIKINDEGTSILVENLAGRKIGGVELVLREGTSCNADYYKITWMYLDQLDPSYKHQGIRRAVLLFHQETFQLPLTAEQHDGVTRADGSELTGDAPMFVDQMRSEGIIEPYGFPGSIERFGPEFDETGC